jgi:hypothetical protein
MMVIKIVFWFFVSRATGFLWRRSLRRTACTALPIATLIQHVFELLMSLAFAGRLTGKSIYID